MLKFKKMATMILATVGFVVLGSAQAALADHDDWRKGHDNHWGHSNKAVYRVHHDNRYYNNRNNSRYNSRYYNHSNSRYYNRPHTVQRSVNHVLRHL
ncbi:MAG: hypothetical protein HYX67_01260 [Candidatus Melainabacteria bacterium]|nr:hypothetical protein [Candidatus Melainabacteria bacterium]